MAEAMKETVANLLKGIDRYNPENLKILEKYVTLTATENVYDLEAYLAVLKLYQFNPMCFQMSVVAQILLKALTNLPHTDFTLCKCLIDAGKLEEDPLVRIINIADLLETCRFEQFWENLDDVSDVTLHIEGFEDSIRKYICHVIGITFQMIKKTTFKDILGSTSDAITNQWISKYGWKDKGDGYIYVANQEDNIKTKNITEKITFDGVAAIMQLSAA